MYILNEMNVKELDELKMTRVGVVSKDGGFTGNTTSRILVIGLGGMGLKTTQRLKKEINDRVGRIDGSYLQILSLDTDAEDRQKALNANALEPDEIPQLNNSGIAEQLIAPAQYRPVSISEIIPNGFTQALTGMGANQVRLAGRLTVMDLNLFNKIYDSIENAIKKLSNFVESTLDVHVVAGIGGGSGSGLVIDIPYITRAVVNKLGIAGSRLRLFGHVYLPNSYSGIANYDAAYRNGYAALKEIDYYMTLKSIGETYNVTYPNTNIGNGGRFSSQDNIFDQCTLIGGKCSAPLVIKDPQAKAIAVCVDDLVNLCTSVKGKIDGDKEGTIADFFTGASFHVNTGTALSTVMSDPNVRFPGEGNYNYNLIGSTAIKFPTEAIAHQLLGEMSLRVEELYQENIKTLSDKDVDEFEKGLINPVDVLYQQENILKKEIDAYFSDPDHVWKIETVDGGVHKTHIDGLVVKAKTAFDENLSIIESAKSAANTKAAAIFADPKKGPYYLAAMLTASTNEGGIRGYYQRIRGYNGMVLELEKKFSDDERTFMDTLNELAEKMHGGLFGGNFKRYLPEYKECLKNVYVASLKRQLCGKLLRDYYVDLNQKRGFAHELKYTLDSAFLESADVITSINAIMKKNLEDANRQIGNAAEDDPSSIFNLTDPVFDALKSTVNNAAADKLAELKENNGVSAYAAALAGAVINDRAAWELTDKCTYGQSKCAKAFRQFIKNYAPFKDIVGRKMIDYFEDAYKGYDDGFKNNVIEKLLSVIKYNSSVMCNVWDPPYFNFQQMQPLCYSYLVLPDGFTSAGNEWGNRFSRVFDTSAPTKNIYWSPDQDAIYCYTLYAKMPIWIHKDLVEYERKYDALDIPGIHINEHPNTLPQMKDYPALMISSQWYRAVNGNIDYVYAHEQAICDKVKTLVKDAIKYGMMVKNSLGAYVIRTITDKPNMDDDRSNIRIKNFVDSYIKDPANKSEKGRLVLDKRVFDRICEKFTVNELIIHPGREGYAPDDEDKAVALIRKQMKLLQTLKDEYKYFEDNILTLIKQNTDGQEKLERARKLAKYMLYGVVFDENGRWMYKLGDTKYDIVLKVTAPRECWNYMEMAACDTLWKLDTFASRHEALLEDFVQKKSVAVATRANNEDAQYVEIINNCDKIKARCNDIIAAVDKRYMEGNILTSAEMERKEFYATVLDEVTVLVSLF